MPHPPYKPELPKGYEYGKLGDTLKPGNKRWNRWESKWVTMYKNNEDIGAEIRYPFEVAVKKNEN